MMKCFDFLSFLEQAVFNKDALQIKVRIRLNVLERIAAAYPT